MSAEEVDSWVEQFADMKPATRRAQREARAKKERRTQQTDKQRERSAVRTEQMNFRCSVEFKADTASMQEHLKTRRKLIKKPSIADVLEEALAMLAKHEGYNG